MERCFEHVTEEQIKSLRELYPKGTDRKGDVKVIYQKCIKWLTENHKYTFQDIYDVVECYVNEQMYAGAGDMLYSLNKGAVSSLLVLNIFFLNSFII